MDPDRPARTLLFAFLAGLALAVLIYAEFLAPSALATDQDAFHYFLAQRIRLAETIGTSAVFWEPAVDCGRPFFADPTVLAVYPGNLVLFLCSPIFAIKLLLLLHVALAATSAAAYARSHKLPPLPAILTGLLYASSGPVLSHSWSPMWIYGLAWLPLAMALTRSILVDRQPRRFLYLGPVVALMILAGAYELLLAYAVYAAIEAGIALLDDRPAGLRGLGALVGAAALALGLAAVQLIPTAELVIYGSRSEMTLDDAALWSLPWTRLPETVAPGLFGTPGARSLDLALVAGHPVEQKPFLGGLYLGVGAVLLALTGLRRAPPKQRGLLLSLILIPAILALGRATPLFALARAVLPGFALFRYPEKIFSLVALPIAVLAGFGLTALRDAPSSSQRSALRAGLVLTSLFTLALTTLFVARGALLKMIIPRLLAARSPTPATEVLGTMTSSLLWSLLAAGLITALVAALNRWKTRPLVFILLALVVIDPVLASRGLQRRGPRDGLLQRPSTLPDPASLSSPAGPARIATLEPARGVRIVPQHGSMLGFESADAYGSVRVGLRQRFDDVFKGSEQQRLALEGVGLALAPLPGRETLYHPMMLEARRVAAPPRLSLVTRARVITDDLEAGAALAAPQFRPGLDLVLDAGNPGEDEAPFAGRILSVERSPASLAIEVEGSRACFLRVNDSFYPGWTAAVDGEAATIRRADVCFRAVAVPAGRHRVTMDYAPRGLWLGLTISILSALITGLLAVARPRAEAEASPEE